MSFGRLQKNILAKISKDYENFLKADSARLKRVNYLQTRLEMMQQQLLSAHEYNQEIIGFQKVEADLQKEDFVEIYEKILEIHADYKSDVLDALDKLQKTESTTGVNSSTTCTTAGSSMEIRRSELRLPKINLPSFSGGYETWRPFHDMFVSLIHSNTSLSEIEKLHYLKSSVSGEAERLLQHLAIDKGNYERAWEILNERYDHKRILVNTQLKLLFGQATITNDSAANIKRVLDTSQEIIHSLQNLGLPVVQWDVILIFVILQKLSPNTQQLWEEKLGVSKELPTFKDFVEFLECRFRSLEAVEQQVGEISSLGKGKGSRSQQVFHTQKQQQLNCKVCKKGQHSVRECKAFNQMDVRSRWQTVRSIKVCENCLAYSHFKHQCPSNKTCYFCKQRHHSLLHQNTSSPSTHPATHNSVHPHTHNTSHAPGTYNPNTIQHCSDTNNYQASVNPSAQAFQPQHSLSPLNSSLNNYHIHTNKQVLLATALLTVKTASGGKITMRALIDPGSEASFITESAVQRLNLKTRRMLTTINGLGRVSSGTSTKVVELSIGSLTSSFAGEMRAIVFKSLTGLLPTQKINLSQWSYLEGLPLADPSFHSPAKVDLLLGSDIYGEIILGDIVKAPENKGPVAQRTQLGWILLGKLPLEASTTMNSFVTQLDLNTTMKKFWEIEEEPFEKYEAEEDKECEKHFQDHTKRLPDGRYQVSLPFKGGVYPSMGPTYHGAVRRFLQLEKRLQANPTQHKEYVQCMSEYIELGHMTLVEDSNEILKSSFHFFIPHHAVIKESSTTTRLRVVFDATFKPAFGSSLNDKLMVGPKIQTNVIDIILRWRKYRFTFTGDVEKMYRQIQVNTADTYYQLILWRENPSQELRIYRLQTVTFGTASAPYLAIRVLLQLADDEALTFPVANSMIKDETYIDDIISGADTIAETQHKLKAVREALATAGFHLRKHVSNSEEVLQHIPHSDRAVDFTVPLGEVGDFQTLGIRWSPILDVFSYRVSQLYDVNVTKRSILSSIAKLYDPMGWIAPCIVKAKIIMQQLWRTGLDWDEVVNPELERKWVQFQQELQTLEKIKIPRWVNFSTNIKKLEVHGFSDASEKAYAAAVYLRVLSEDNQTHMHLLMSKTKVAPLDTVTLPKLELCGAVLLAKLLYETKQILKLTTVDVYAWTDSIITLCWIRASPSKWKTFIANRVSQVQKYTTGASWRYIPSELNPADMASRGIFPSTIVDNKFWWKGPDFLRLHWDLQFPPQPTHLETQEEARTILVHHHLENNLVNELLQKFSKLSKILRIVAYCFRFLRGLSSSRSTPKELNRNMLSPQEIEAALIRITRAVQGEMFPSDEVKENTKGYTALNPFEDGEKILRVGGRLANSTLPLNKKHPILLKANHRLAELIIEDAHEKTFHGGSQKTIAYIRQRFWIFNLKSAVKKHVFKCNICFRFRAKPMVQLMGSLPAARTTISRPFTFAGVDYAGPVDIKTWRGRNAKTLKGYFALFVCMATKAMHIELVSDMTTQAFIAAFRRFVSRRGLCRELFSDCGSNFVGAEAELKKLMVEATLNWENVAETLASEGTKWNFIPPAAPHFGGLWEAGVKSVKFHLKRVAGNQILTFEELNTLLTQVEAVLNSRPLCPLSDDVNDLQPLTPAHFLIGEPLIGPPQPDYELEKISCLERWKRVQALSQTFWKQWSTEYLHRLQQRPKWMRTSDSEIKEGNLVLIKDERLPPLKWSLARVSKLHPGRDGIVRVVTLKAEKTEFKRPIAKICPLPSNKPNTDITQV